MNLIQRIGLATAAAGIMFMSGCKEPDKPEPAVRKEPLVEEAPIAKEETVKYETPKNEAPVEQEIPGKKVETPKTPEGKFAYTVENTITFDNENTCALAHGYVNSLAKKTENFGDYKTARMYTLSRIAGDGHLTESELEKALEEGLSGDYSKVAKEGDKIVYKESIVVYMTAEQEKSIKQLVEENKPSKADLMWALDLNSKKDGTLKDAEQVKACLEALK